MSAPQIQTTATDYKPWGLTAGAIVGQEQYDKEAANIQALKEAQLNNVVNQQKAMVAQGQMDNPEWLQAKLAGEIGQGRSLEATGKFDSQTLDGRIKSQVAEYAAKVPESKFKQEQAEAANRLSAMTKIYSSLEANQWNPGAIQAAAQQAGPELGIPQEMLSKFVGLPPQELKKALEHFMSADKQLVTFTPQVRQKMAEQEQAGVIQEGIHAGDRKSREKVSAADNATRASVEQMGIDAGKYKRGGSGVSITTIYAKMTPEARLGAVQKVLTTGVDPETNEPLTEMAKAGYESMYNQDKRTVDAKNTAKGANKVDLNAAGVQATTTPSVGDSGAKPVSGGHWEVQGGKKVWVKGQYG